MIWSVSVVAEHPGRLRRLLTCVNTEFPAALPFLKARSSAPQCGTQPQDLWGWVPHCKTSSDPIGIDFISRDADSVVVDETRDGSLGRFFHVATLTVSVSLPQDVVGRLFRGEAAAQDQVRGFLRSVGADLALNTVALAPILLCLRQTSVGQVGGTSDRTCCCPHSTTCATA